MNKKWVYIADKKGQRVEGKKEGKSKREIIKLLKAEGIYPLEVREEKSAVLIKKKERKKIDIKYVRDSIQSKVNQIPDKEIGRLFDNLEVLLESDVTLTDAWKIVKSNKNSKKMNKFLKEVETKINKGYTLSSSLESYPFMTKLSLAMLKTGEEIGDLSNAFKQVANLYNQKDTIKNKIMKAISYPIFLILTIVIMVYMISTKVLPPLIDGMGDQLNTNKITDGFILLSEILQNHSILLLLGVLSVTVLPALVYKIRNPRGFDYTVLSIPLFGDILRKRIEIAVLKNFSLLYSGGLDALLILDMLGSISHSILYLENIDEMKKGVRRGEPISKHMSEFIYTPTAINIFKVSEATGNVVEPFAIVADSTERQLDDSISAFVGLITPLAVVLLASIVLLLIVGIMLPIFSIYN